MSGREKGFTVLELMVVVLIIGTVTGAVFPHLQRSILRARAAEAVSEMRTVKMAVLSYQASEGEWPEDVTRGETPPGLEDYLPEGFDFARERFVLDYDDWSDSDPYLVGITLITDESDLGNLVLEILGTDTWTDGAEKYSWVIEWTD